MALPEPDIKDLQLRTNLEAIDQRLSVVDGSQGSGVAGGFVPSGGISAFAGSSAPSGWLICDGSAVSRTTYARLFSILSTTYGVGDGSTTFNLPDLRGRAPYGVGTHTDVDALGENDGVSVASRTPKHTLTTAEIPSHTHSATAPYTTAAGGTTSGTGIPPHNSTPSGGNWSTTTGSTGSGGAHDHGFIALNFIIKT